jgi:hypothetical protein
MANRWKKKTILSVLLVFGLILAILPSLVSASHNPENPIPSTVTPEPYPNSDIYPADVVLVNQDDLLILYRLKIDIDGLHRIDGSPASNDASFKSTIATVYIDPDQALLLNKAGLNPIPIPNEGYRSFLAYGPGSDTPNAWPQFDQYVWRMQALEIAHPDIVALVQIGTSVLGRGLYCMEITDHPGLDENEPEFKYTANHHGDETTGVEMTMRLAELLANSYGVDPVMTDMVDKMEIWLCPIYNPDGYVAGTRNNAHGVNLNRDFPDRFTDPIDDPAGHEPETQAFMNFGYAHRFVMGANYHGGAQVLNYPWDAVAAPGDPEVPAYAPDDKLFFDFGLGYTSRNSYLWNGGWPSGMTRGWEWYQVWGGMQDWAYYYHGEHHVTLEISNTKMPPFNQMDSYWDQNRDAMLWWIQRVWTGLGGLVLDARDNTPLDATLTLVGKEIPNTILTDPDVGDYHRVISPGDYTLDASANCYRSQSDVVNVISGTATIKDFYLYPLIDLSPSVKTVSVKQANPEDIVNYQVRVENACLSTIATITDTLPTQVTWTGYLTATQGIPTFDSGRILWQGEVVSSEPVTITYAVSLNQCLEASTTITNLAEINDGVNTVITRTAEMSVSNASPGLPSIPDPVDGAHGQPIDTILTWAPSSDLNCDPITYSIAFGTTSPPDYVATGLPLPAFNPGALLPGTTYYWSVTAHDGLTQTPGPIWSFTTTPLMVFLPVTLR